MMSRWRVRERNWGDVGEEARVGRMWEENKQYMWLYLHQSCVEHDDTTNLNRHSIGHPDVEGTKGLVLLRKVETPKRPKT